MISFEQARCGSLTATAAREQLGRRAQKLASTADPGTPRSAGSMQRTHNALPDHKAHHRYATYIVCAVSATALRLRLEP
jgi:hypothetical protein